MQRVPGYCHRRWDSVRGICTTVFLVTGTLMAPQAELSQGYQLEATWMLLVSSTLTAARMKSRPTSHAHLTAGRGVGVVAFFFYRQQDQGVFAQQVYYTSLKPTDAEEAPGAYSAYRSVVSLPAGAPRANPPAHTARQAAGAFRPQTLLHIFHHTGEELQLAETTLNGYSRCFSRRLQRHSIRLTLITIYIIQN